MGCNQLFLLEIIVSLIGKNTSVGEIYSLTKKLA
jgi:hypothetical protein